MRWVVACAAGFLALLSGPVPASAAPAAPEPLCTMKDSRIGELSGLVSDGSKLYAINDGGTKVQVFVLGRDCKVQKVLTDKTDPFDVEDLARTPDGTLWLSDTGDNKKGRLTVALLEMSPAGKLTLHRLTYPDGQHDTEALIMDKAGTPYLITKDILGQAQVYRPSGPLGSPGPTNLEKVGTVKIETTDTQGGPVGSIGSVLVTGGASTADGSVVALRTYTDAYLYPAPDGDVLAALQRTPVRVPLAGEKQGESIAFDPDGTLLSGSEGVGQPIRAVKGAAALAVASSDEKPASSAAGGSASDGGGVPYLPAAGIAVAVVGLGWFGFSKLRRRRG
ncbi:esterase-like activity of phytase family protein [Amycolatopsis sp. OK19-0408]|uniref:Esterase-like activity of phytase family protein n=1 Tax=Amycolatopsis iheyensis TaxID=2945988 RepID=A0A9X2NKQ4_9PSEU|nr:esterase-like activity of phytase family protein [Amycolatopsis iheyensis]MCR6488072.1 esterase-like activity of phytase family protein [Amycolatopsis iheyensis]